MTSLHYSIDPFSTAGAIIDVTASRSGGTACTGALVIRVPEGVSIKGHPTDRDALLTAKKNGLLALNPGFADAHLEPCLTSGGVDPGSSVRVMIGGHATQRSSAQHCILPNGVLATTKQTLLRAPDRCLVTWEVYSFLDQDPIGDRFTRQYVEQDASVLICELAFGANPARVVTNGVAVSLPLAEQSPDFVLKFKNTKPGASRVWLGSWSVLY